MNLDRQRYTVFCPYTICRPNTKTKRLAVHPHTHTHPHRRSVFFFSHVAIRNSLRSNKTFRNGTSKTPTGGVFRSAQQWFPRELRVVRTHSCRYCALSRLGGRDIAGGVCFKNPTGGDFRRTGRKTTSDREKMESKVRKCKGMRLMKRSWRPEGIKLQIVFPIRPGGKGRVACAGC